MKKHLFYTFLTVFALTAVITLLGILKLGVSIDEFYLKGLFAALLIELVGAVIAIYRKTDFFNGGVQEHEPDRDGYHQEGGQTLMSNTSVIPEPTSYGVTIIEPEARKEVAVTTVRGTIKKRLPPGHYSVKSLSWYTFTVSLTLDDENRVVEVETASY